MSKYYWTNKEIALMREHYATKGAPWIMSKLPHRSRDAVYVKARELGLSRRWTRQEEQLLRKHYPAHGTDGLVRLLNRDLQAIRSKAMHMGLRYDRYRRRAWNDMELQVLRNHFPTGGVPEVMNRIPHRGRDAIYMQARRLGIKSIHGPGRRATEAA